MNSDRQRLKFPLLTSVALNHRKVKAEAFHIFSLFDPLTEGTIFGVS